MAVVSYDLRGKVSAWNPAAERIFGWTQPEVIGSHPPIVPAEKRQQLDEMLRKNLDGQITPALETIHIDRNNRPFPVSVSAAPVYDEKGELTSLVEVIEDISERKRIELELHEKTSVLTTVTQALNTFLDSGDWSAASRHLLNFAIRQTQSEYGFLGVVLEGPVLRVLSHEGIVWDVTLNRELYKTSEVDHSRMAQYHDYFLRKVISQSETVVANSLEINSQSGTDPAVYPPMYSFLGVPILKAKEIVGLIAVANRPGGYTGQESRYLETMSQATGVLYDNYRQNIQRGALEEEQKRLEAQVEQAQKMEVLGRLAGGVAHDFNNLLMVLGSSSELLDRSLPLESTARTYLNQIRLTTEKAAAITRQLLTFSRKQVVESRSMDLHEALAACEFMLPRLLGSDIELTFRHEARKPWIHGNPSQIEQVVANLAINARDAMPDGGKLTIATRCVTHLPEQNGDTPPSDRGWIVLEVADSGCGMDEKTRAQIFEPFFTTKPPGKGTGLGLATVYGIVKQSRGQIHVDTAPGKGTRFEIYFPAAEPLPSPVPPPAPFVMEDSGAGMTILVADDEAALRRSMVELLRAAGYTVHEALTSTEAIEIAERPEKIDILLTDIVMPGLRGPELARRVIRLQPDIQIIYMSGYADDFPEAKLPPGAVFLQKPFRFATLLEQLKLVRRKA